MGNPRKTSSKRKRKDRSLKGVEAKRRRLEATTTSTSTASTSTTRVLRSSGEGRRTAGESALTGPSPTVSRFPFGDPS